MNKKQLKYLPKLDKRDPPYKSVETARIVHAKGFHFRAFVAGTEGSYLVYSLRPPPHGVKNYISGQKRTEIRDIRNYEVL